MRLRTVEHCVLGFVALGALIWLDLLPTGILGRVAIGLLGWAAFSTLLVASAGAWVAFARARARPARRRRDDKPG
jgi:hypothetical protein